MQNIWEYRVENRGPTLCGDGVTRPDFVVVLYIDGKWENEWGNLWSKEKATNIADRENTDFRENWL